MQYYLLISVHQTITKITNDKSWVQGLKLSSNLVIDQNQWHSKMPKLN